MSSTKLSNWFTQGNRKEKHLRFFHPRLQMLVTRPLHAMWSIVGKMTPPIAEVEKMILSTTGIWRSQIAKAKDMLHSSNEEQRNPFEGRQTMKNEMHQEEKENHLNYNYYRWQNTILAWNRLWNRNFNVQYSIRKDGLLAFFTHKIQH